MSSYVSTLENLEINPQVITNFNTKLSQTVIENTPKTEIRHYTHELPPFIIQLIKRKRRMYREYKNTGDPTAKADLNKFNKNIQNLIKEYRTHKWITTCEEINRKKGQTYWTDIKKLSKYKNINVTQSIIEQNGKKYETNEEKSNIFAKHFKNVYKERQDLNFDNEFYEQVSEWYESYITEQPTIEVFKIDEEYFEIVNQGKSTAPGYDYVTKNILRSLNIDVHLYIIKIYEYCLKFHHIPDEWKLGTIITLPKPNTDHTKTDNYRPITLLPVIGKNFEKIIKNRIWDKIGSRIPGYQFGFKPKSSTLHPLTVLTNNIETAKLNDKKSAAVFLDISKAFDSVWHKGLIYKLVKLNCPKYLVFLIIRILEHRKLRVKISSSYSSDFTAEQGLPQGSPLSPILYNIYCYDIYHHAQGNEEHFSFEAYMLQFADDNTLVSHGNKLETVMANLQNLINTTTIWFNKWRLAPNPAKSHLIIFNHTPTDSSPSITLYNHTLKPKTYTKYLGILIDHKINFNIHTLEVKKKTIARAKHFRSLTFNKRELIQQQPVESTH